MAISERVLIEELLGFMDLVAKLNSKNGSLLHFLSENRSKLPKNVSDFLDKYSAEIHPIFDLLEPKMANLLKLSEQSTEKYSPRR